MSSLASLAGQESVAIAFTIKNRTGGVALWAAAAASLSADPNVKLCRLGEMIQLCRFR